MPCVLSYVNLCLTYIVIILSYYINIGSSSDETNCNVCSALAKL